MGSGVALMLFCTGMTFAGYKLFRVSIIAVGTGAAGLPVFVYAYDNLPISDDNVALGVAGVMAGLAALIGGVLCWRLFKLGVFILGGSLGAITALLLQILVFARFLPALGNTPLIVAGVVLGLGVGGLSLVAARPTMIIATSVLGAYGAIRGVSMLVPNTFLAELTLAKRVQAGETLPATMDGYLGGIAAMALVGVLVQFFVTATKKSKDGDKDDLEKELEDSEISINALQGKTKKKKGGSKEKKSKGKGKKGAKSGNKLKNDALLRDYEEGGEFFEGGYDEAWVGEEGEEDYSQEHYELPPVPSTNAAPAKKSWWSRGKKEEQGKGGGGGGEGA